MGKNRCVFHMNIRYSLQQKDIFACQTGNLNLREKKNAVSPQKHFFADFAKAKFCCSAPKRKKGEDKRFVRLPCVLLVPTYIIA